ncbi:transcriptional regulator family: Fungal Specific TF [Penicillium roqueforti]|uniref:transcriptional regulator family: Fungal Specific TF n=1 Tax=Penicillium roqueforti TaxID=5082 RepID=UPI00190BA6AB|nr:transcriptional regulator family: Fungal Specific TF [Penicillium roqueforti]KAF9240575.1 transcriptional regulator family: Fungal Specific TF [Penicillium roqueforti]KAI1830730.1 transcriptional regulator family: Fungal Specific TF [Penicillium roqueforti]KAI2674522.1 transcriptional regulator family: Fungal Specific TF [Penicillium roqueforti]KAI2683818.1 transcriptional regulator family: Fungal Specific TF [Penicillium roqueforti]KAI2696752.1 transcriptional regulator family: Fungal Spec
MPTAPDEPARRKRPGRKYTSRACETCRQRRAKCDGVRPSCSRCLDRGVQCEYSTAEDGRQPAPKSYVVMLRNRIELLERVLHTHGIDPDAAIQLMIKNGEPNPEWAPASSNVDDLCTTFDGALTLDESLNFDQDGEVRYFGPTSGRLLFRSSSKDSPSEEAYQSDGPPMQTGETPPNGSTESLEESLIPEDELQSHLLDLYFEWEQPWLQVSLAIMGMAYIAMGSDAAGWLHQGMANRLALDMGFNMDPSVLSGAVALPPIEIELRRQIYWALYCHDKLSASYTGRVCTLLDSQGVVNKPFPLCASDVYLPSANGNRQLRAASQRDVVQLHRAMIDLCRIFEKVLLTFWSPKPLLQPQQRCAFFESCVLELKTWYYDLPPELKVDRQSGPSRFPHTYTLCMVYHTVCILLCVPFLSNNSATQDVGNPPDPQTQQNRSHKEWGPACKQKVMTICSNSARGMCIVAQKYRQTFGSFKLSPMTATHCILSAASIIIDRWCVDPTVKTGTGNQSLRGPSPQAAVGLCLQVLRELSTSWNIAKRIGRNLEKLYCKRLNCDIDHMPPAPSLECNSLCTIPYQPEDGDLYPGPMAPTESFQGLPDPKDLHVENTILPTALPDINWFDVPTASDTQHDNNDVIGLGAASNPDELFINNLGFAFSANSLPSDYNMFDTLNQMYLEDIW